MSDVFEFLKGKSVSWARSASKEDLIEFLRIFKIVDVLRIVNLEELKSVCRKTDKKEKANSSTKEELVEILSVYKVEQILNCVNLNELRKVTKKVITAQEECQRQALEEENKKQNESSTKSSENTKLTDTRNENNLGRQENNSADEQEMANKDDMKVNVFDGRNYSIWKKRILLHLKYKKCDAPAIREKAATERQEEWDDLDLKAMNYIYCSINDEQLEFVSDQDTALKIMKKFDEIYLKESTALQICIRNKIERLKLKDFDESSTFFSEFEKAINELKSAGAKVSEREKLDYILKTLPDSLNYLGDLIDAMQERDRTCEFVKNKISMWEVQSKGENGKKKPNAFQVEKKNYKCYGCGRLGHLKKDCRNMWRHGNDRRGLDRATEQGGAFQSTYIKQSQQFRSRGREGGRGQNYGRGRGRSWQQRGGGASQHDARYSERYHDEEIGTFLVRVEKNANEAEAYSCEINNVDWILDSGCSDHIINDDSIFLEYVNLREPIDVKVGDGRILKGTKIGNVMTYFTVYGKKIKITMSNVYFVKEMDKNLISFAKVTDTNKVVSIGETSKIYNGYGNLIGIALKKNGLYKISSIIERKKSYVGNIEKMTLKEKYHRLLGHVNFQYLDRMCKDKLVEGMPNELEKVYLKCGTCIQNKMHNLRFENNRNRAKEILELIHTDLNGPHTTTGYDGSKYFLSFIDDFSKCAIVYPIKSKTEVTDCFVEYLNKVENLTGKRVKRLRCDNGREYINNEMFNLIKNRGIFMEPCLPYTHELNGTAERYNRSIMNSARCLLSESKVQQKYWPEVIKAAAYLRNRTVANTIENKTPFEILFGIKPNIKNLKLYGSKVFARVSEVKRNSKWDKKADIGTLVGYENNGYRVLIDNKVVLTRHVEIVEDNENLIGIGNANDNDDISEKKFDRKSISSEIKNDEQFIENENYSQKELRSSTRDRKKPDRYGNAIGSNYIYVNVVSADSPTTYEETVQSNDYELWKEAMDREINCLKKNKTWELVDKPKNTKILDLKWVYTNKSDGRKKARLVVRGFQQREILEDIYSPVAKVQTLKLLLAYCVQFELIIMQMDVETAFLNGIVKSEVYVKQPKGYDDGTEKVCKLIKALYGLRESPRAWYECFDEFIIKLGFQRSSIDYCFYILHLGDELIFLILFVDDLLICSKNRKKIEEIKNKLSERFVMKDLGEIKTYLGINIEYDHKKCEMTLDQSDYIESLARKYNLENAKLYATPMEQNLSLEPTQSASDEIKYRNLIGALLYICSGTRLDVSYSVNYMSRFQNSYNETHYKYALRILKYLYLTKDLRLTYKKNLKNDIIDCFVDADWAGDKVDRKSTTGFVIRFFGNVIYWKTRKQNSVTKSSTAAEYVALSECVSEIKFIMKLLKEFKIEIEKPISIYEDNSGAIAIAKFGNFTKNSKHIEIHYHFVNESYEDGTIRIIKIESELNLADILTKALGRIKFEKFRNSLNIV